MKLHTKLPLTEFPLQEDPNSEHEGWTFTEFLKKYGFSQQPCNPANSVAAMQIITGETHAGRYPLLAFLPPWHIVVAVKDGNEIRIADPRDKKFITKSSIETKSAIQDVIQNGGRPFLDMLTYS